MSCVIFLLKFRSEIQREQKRAVLSCEREIKSNKWLAEGNTIAFGKVGSTPTSRSGRACHSSRSVALPWGTCYLCETSPSVGRHWTFQERTNDISFLCLAGVANGQCKERGGYFWGEELHMSEERRSQHTTPWRCGMGWSSQKIIQAAVMACIPSASCGLGVICLVNTLDDEKGWLICIFFFLLPTQAAIFGMKYGFW